MRGYYRSVTVIMPNRDANGAGGTDWGFIAGHKVFIVKPKVGVSEPAMSHTKTAQHKKVMVFTFFDFQA